VHVEQECNFLSAVVQIMDANAKQQASCDQRGLDTKRTRTFVHG